MAVIPLSDLEDILVLNKKLHYWKDDLKGMALMLSGNERLPHFRRSGDGALIIACDDCRKALQLRRKFQDLQKEKQCESRISRQLSL